MGTARNLLCSSRDNADDQQDQVSFGSLKTRYATGPQCVIKIDSFTLGRNSARNYCILSQMARNLPCASRDEAEGHQDQVSFGPP